MNINDAMDIVDTWGPDADLWPTSYRDTLKELQRTDEDFDNYVRQMKHLDDLLANWDETDDGADINWDKALDPGADPIDDASDGEEDEDEQFGPGGEDDDEDEEAEGAPGTVDPDAPREGEIEIPEIDPEALKDMDEMLSNFIRQHAEQFDDGEFRVFTRDFDEMVDISGCESADIDKIDTAVAKAVGPLSKDMRRLIAARSQVKRLPGRRSGRLHAPNLHRIMAGDDRVFFRREEAAELDTAISLVIDCSGSMGGQRIQLAAETAYAIGSVLNRLGVQFECLGFTCASGDPRTNSKAYAKEIAEADAIARIIRDQPIAMPKFKAFDERWTQPIQRRFAHVYNTASGIAMNSTPEGCGIEFAARRLLQRPEKRKLMIVMTDGEACGPIYWGARGYQASDHAAYMNQSRKVIKSVQASGIDIVGVGIQHAGVKKNYPRHLVIKSLEDMPAQLMAVLKEFMIS